MSAGEFWLAAAKFTLLVLASKTIGNYASKLKFPLISGYLLSGILIGPFVFKFMDTSEVKELSFITDFALATIAFCAGSELYFPEIRNLFRTIAINISMIVLMSFVIMPPVVYIIAPAIPFLADFSGVCLANVSVLVGCLMLERSASSALGVISELKAKGVLTKTFLGITVVSDVVLLVLYAITSTFAEAACTDLGFNGKTIVSLVISFSVCFVSGVMLGFLLIFYLWIPKIPSALRGALILPTGYAVVYLSNYVRKVSPENTGYDIDMEPLLLCMIASCIAGNNSRNRKKFANILHKSAPYIFLPFFTLTGAALNLNNFLDGLWFAIYVVFFRAISIFLAIFIAGKYILKKNPEDYKMLFMTLIPQAGTLLGLVGQLASYGDWAVQFSASIVTSLLINNLIGLRMLKWAIANSGEAFQNIGAKNKGKGRRVYIVGLNQFSLSVAVKVLEQGFSVAVIPSRRLSEQTIENYRTFISDAVEETILAFESSTPIDFKIINEPFSYDENAQTKGKVVFEGVRVDSIQYEKIFSKETHAILVCPSNESKSVEICKSLKKYQEDHNYNVRISSISNLPSIVQQLEELDIISFCRSSLVSDFMARFITQKLTGEDIVFQPIDIQSMIHPIEESPELSFEGTFDLEEEDHARKIAKLNTRAVRASKLLKSRRKSFDEKSTSSGQPNNYNSHQKALSVSNLNELSGLSILGLADTTIESESPERTPQITYNIFSREFKGLNQMNSPEDPERESLLGKNDDSFQN